MMIGTPESAIDLLAPTGDELQGTYEKVTGAASCYFTEEDGSAFQHTGGTEFFWDGMTTQTIQGATVFLCDSGMEWLQHHLIPDNAEGLPEDVIRLFKEEMNIGEALEAADELAAMLKRLDLPIPTIDMRNGLRLAYEAAKAASIAARARALAEQEAMADG